MEKILHMNIRFGEVSYYRKWIYTDIENIKPDTDLEKYILDPYLEKYIFDLGKWFNYLDITNYTDDEYRNMARIAVKQHGFNLLSMIPEFITEDLCKLAIRNGCPLGVIPKEFRTLDVCIEAVLLRHISIIYCEEHVSKILELLKDIAPELQSIIDTNEMYDFSKDIEQIEEGVK